MLTGISKKIELAANVAIIIVACLLATVLVKNYLLAKPAKQEVRDQLDSQPMSKPSVSSLNINWNQNRQTLILAISSTCHFCSESAPFYRKLAQNKGDTRLVALLPQPVEEARKYLERLGVSVDEVRQLPLDQIGIYGTPSVLLVDASGIVKNFWQGKLTADKEVAVLDALRNGKG